MTKKKQKTNSYYLINKESELGVFVQEGGRVVWKWKYEARKTPSSLQGSWLEEKKNSPQF